MMQPSLNRPRSSIWLLLLILCTSAPAANGLFRLAITYQGTGCSGSPIRLEATRTNQCQPGTFGCWNETTPIGDSSFRQICASSLNLADYYNSQDSYCISGRMLGYDKPCNTSYLLSNANFIKVLRADTCLPIGGTSLGFLLGTGRCTTYGLPENDGNTYASSNCTQVIATTTTTSLTTASVTTAPPSVCMENMPTCESQLSPSLNLTLLYDCKYGMPGIAAAVSICGYMTWLAIVSLLLMHA